VNELLVDKKFKIWSVKVPIIHEVASLHRQVHKTMTYNGG